MLPWYHPNRALRLTHRHCYPIPHGCNAPTRLHLLTTNRFRTATRGSFSQELLYRAFTCRDSLCHTAPATRPVIVFWDLLELLYYIRLCAFCQEKFTNRQNRLNAPSYNYNCIKESSQKLPSIFLQKININADRNIIAAPNGTASSNF